MKRILRYEDLYAGVWLVFLLLPVLFVALYSDAGVWWDVGAYVAIAAFAVIYIVVFRCMIARDMPSIVAGARPNLGLASIGTVLLLGCIAITVPSLGPNATAMMPFLAALWMWALPMGLAMFAAAVWWFVSMGFIWLYLGPDMASVWIGPTMALLFICFFRFFNERAAREESLATELATAREREEISRDVHDLLGHSLTAVSLKAQVASRFLRTEPDRAEAELEELLQLTQCSLEEVRGVVGRMSTPDLASQLAAAREVLEAAEVHVEVRGASERVPAPRRAMFAWALREGTTNVVRHAQAANVTITLEPDRLEVADDGRGICAEEGHGLTGLRRRIEEAGATLRLRPTNAALERPGTQLIVEYES
ncbi:sensor histidine kinase [Gulosibacter sediminis]|uniref:sensor histidine kinase n=1 Tax=Gulosibacter sediminis TaxID=1729695 RepID=UPI0024ADC49B|nr:histidine kinase [Gulosibacter sediminis]